MAKAGCGACGKLHGHSMLECIGGSLPAPTVELVPQPELPAPRSTVTALKVPLQPAESTVTPKNRAWEQRNPERYRKWRREYMKRRRST